MTKKEIICSYGDCKSENRRFYLHDAGLMRKDYYCGISHLLAALAVRYKNNFEFVVNNYPKVEKK